MSRQRTPFIDVIQICEKEVVEIINFWSHNGESSNRRSLIYKVGEG